MKRIYLFTICVLLAGLTIAQNKPKGNTTQNAQSSSTQHLSCLTIKTADYYYENLALYNVVSSALTALLNLTADAYYDYSSQKEYVKNLLQSQHVAFVDNELQRLTKVKSIQINGSGVFEYNFFACSFRQKNNSVYYRKTTGSQRQNGYLYRIDDKTRYFMGAWSVNDDPIKEYGSDQSIIGAMYKLSSGKYIMVIPEGNNCFNILEFK